MTDAEERKLGERKGLETPVVLAVNYVRWILAFWWGSELTHEADRLGSTTARLKLKGIDGKAHNQGSMWFNSIRSDGPYPDLTFYRFIFVETRRDLPKKEMVEQLLHGCRQLVPWGVDLSVETSATLILC